MESRSKVLGHPLRENKRYGTGKAYNIGCLDEKQLWVKASNTRCHAASKVRYRHPIIYACI